jgi:hypothetical protein
MPASQPANFNLQEFTDAGRLLVGGRIYTYSHGTTAQKTAYTDPDGTVPHTYTLDGAGGQYIALNARGELNAPLYLGAGSYDITLKRADGSTVWTRKADGVDNTTNSLIAAVAASSGSGLMGFMQDAAGAVVRTVLDVLRERKSLLDFMSNEQRTAVYSGAAVDHTSAFTKAEAYLNGGRRTVFIPAGTYHFADTFDVPAGSCLKIDPKAVLNFTSTVSPVIRIRRGVSFHGNLAQLDMTNAAWDGVGMLLDGSDQFLDTYPTFISGLRMNSAAFPKGSMLHLQAVNAREFITFVHFRDFSSGSNMKYTLTVACGNSGTVGDNSSWHWITSNVFENFTSFAKHLMSVVGLDNVPAEVSANQFLNFHHQTGDNPGLPVYFFGACNNTFTGWIWDWDNSISSPIVFDGGAKWNNIKTNVDTSVVTTAQNNKVEDLTGGETGQKYFWGEVLHFGRTFLGRTGVTGKYATTFYPDLANEGRFHAVNTGSVLKFAAGADAYASTSILNIRGDGTVVVGGSDANSTISTFRTNGAPFRSARATRLGSDGYAADLYENEAGTTVGSVVVNTSSTTYNTSSDYRLKDLVQPLVGSGDFIDRIRPVSWVWKVDGSSGAGFIAHELQAVSPTSVHGEKDALDEQGHPIYQAVEYGSAEVIANLVAEVQSIRKRLSAAGLS